MRETITLIANELSAKNKELQCLSKEQDSLVAALSTIHARRVALIKSVALLEVEYHDIYHKFHSEKKAENGCNLKKSGAEVASEIMANYIKNAQESQLSDHSFRPTY